MLARVYMCVYVSVYIHAWYICQYIFTRMQGISGRFECLRINLLVGTAAFEYRMCHIHTAYLTYIQHMPHTYSNWHMHTAYVTYVQHMTHTYSKLHAHTACVIYLPHVS
jgi:hypothetical protein